MLGKMWIEQQRNVLFVVMIQHSLCRYKLDRQMSRLLTFIDVVDVQSNGMINIKKFPVTPVRIIVRVIEWLEIVLLVGSDIG
jgi:hypothetical protein